MLSRQKCIRLWCICVCLLFCIGCHPFTGSWKQEAPPNPTKYLEEFSHSQRYTALDSRLQACYGSLYTALTDRFTQDTRVTLNSNQPNATAVNGTIIALPQTLYTQEEAQQVFNAVVYDNPHFFYINNHFGLEGYEKKDTAHYTTILLTYTMDAATRKQARDQLETALNTIQQHTPDTTDEYIIEAYLHEHLTSHCIYDHDAAEVGFDQKPNAYSAYGALVEGKAVCEGYSRAMQLLLKQHDIASTPVIGESIETGEQHMWNLVTINGEAYHLDATWNDSEDGQRHNYFNVTTEQISLSHRIHTDKQSIPVCTATADNYFYRNGLYVDTYRRQDIAAIIARRILAGDTQIELQFAADKYDSALLFLKNATAAAEQINPYLADSGQKLWEYRLFGKTAEHILCIRKK